jgi:uncharacterized protein (DUF433 family)
MEVSMSTVPVYISQSLYEQLQIKAAESNHSPDEIVEGLLRRDLSHPYIIVETTRFGERAIIKGTRVSVAAIVSYNRLGFSPEKIAHDILPHITTVQAEDALDYYSDHPEEINQELADDPENVWMRRLREMAGSDEAFIRMTGGRIPIND